MFGFFKNIFKTTKEGKILYDLLQNKDDWKLVRIGYFSAEPNDYIVHKSGLMVLNPYYHDKLYIKFDANTNYVHEIFNVNDSIKLNPVIRNLFKYFYEKPKLADAKIASGALWALDKSNSSTK